MKLDQTNEIMSHIKLSEDDQLTLREFYFKSQTTMDLQEEYDMFFSDIPSSFKMIVQHHLFNQCLMQNFIIIDLVGVENLQPSKQIPMLNYIIERMGTIFTSPEEIIIQEGDESVDLFFIQQGDCLITQMGMNHNIKNIRLLCEGDYFGELGCLYKTKRTCSVICRYYTTLARIT